jgi:hypothetical protein
MLSDSDIRKLNKATAKKKTDIDTSIRREVETLSLTEIWDLFFEAIEERDTLRIETKNQRFELKNLEAQVNLLIGESEDWQKYFDQSQKWLSDAHSVGSAYWELKDSGERSEDGVIALLTGLIEWAYGGYGEPGRAVVERLRKKGELPF